MNKNLIDFKLLHAVCRVQMNCFALKILWRRLRNCSGYVHLLLQKVMFKKSWSVKYQRLDESTFKVIRLEINTLLVNIINYETLLKIFFVSKLLFLKTLFGWLFSVLFHFVSLHTFHYSHHSKTLSIVQSSILRINKCKRVCKSGSALKANRLQSNWGAHKFVSSRNL